MARSVARKKKISKSSSMVSNGPAMLDCYVFSELQMTYDEDFLVYSGSSASSNGT